MNPIQNSAPDNHINLITLDRKLSRRFNTNVEGLIVGDDHLKYLDGSNNETLSSRMSKELSKT
jgi:hypothetical protein